MIDIFYKIKYLKQAGIHIILHCFDYGRGKQNILNQYCDKVYYYKRHLSLKAFFSLTPYIVKTRQSKILLQNLCQDNYPILFEGVHSCYYLNDNVLQKHQKILRAHNVETEYYYHLFKNEKNIFNKIFFYCESLKLKRFEKQLNHADSIVTVSLKDQIFFAHYYSNTYCISSFHPHENISIQSGFGTYVLYHGNLSVNENQVAAEYLINEIFSNINIPFIIAGLNPNKILKHKIEKYKHIRLIENPSDSEMEDLIQQAHINILITFQPTGLKLKLLHALYCGRHCLVNSNMIAGSETENLCHIANTSETLKEKVLSLMQLPFLDTDIAKRKEILDKKHSNKLKTKQLIDLLKI